MNILVTGAFGQLGSWMRILSVGSADNYVFADVAGPGEGQPEMLRRLGGPDVPTGCVSLDITDAEAVRTAVLKHKTDVIVNCAAFTNVDAAEDREELAEALNATAVGNMAAAARDAGALLVHVSTDYVFGGDPYDALLDLQAIYTVNGVPLSDLQLGNSFSSNNVRVDCLMNISGTPQSPHVDFNIDMPTVSDDAEQMVRTVINSEEEMNQQVVYLLGVGRFYIQGNNNSSNQGQPNQTSLAMQSLLSGTISQQINTILGSLVKNNNWTFGANISTGDEGFNNAEYEGLLSGRLLNNRLIINGQFGYRDNENATTSFIGDFDINYLLLPNGNIALKVYNQTNDRYFTKSSLNTQGIGLILKKDFNSLMELFGFKRKSK